MMMVGQGWHFLNSFVVVFSVMVLFVRSVVAAAECVIAEPHITLGDMFSLDSKDREHALTIGFTVKGLCNEFPTVGLLLHNNTIKMINVAEQKHFSEALRDGSYYDRRAGFYKISNSDRESSISWTIYSDGKPVVGPNKFPTRPFENDTAIKLFVVADMDISEQSIHTMQRITEIRSSEYDLLMHIGDFAYDIDDENGKRGDEFFQAMSSTTRRIPYIITPGNHERRNRGELLNYRFRMPNTDTLTTGGRSNNYFDMVYKHTYFMFINFDYILNMQGIDRKNITKAEYEILDWMKQRVSLLKKRKDVKWRIFSSHRPFACVNELAPDDCMFNPYFYRRIEDLAAKSGFHFLLQAHLHTYARHKPMVGLKMYPLKQVGKGAFFTIINGHAGTSYYFEGPDRFNTLWGPFIDAVDVSTSTYTILDISPERFQGRLIASDSGVLKDSFFVDRNSVAEDTFDDDEHLGFHIFLILVAVATAIAIAAYIGYRLKYRYHPRYFRSIALKNTVHMRSSVAQAQPGNEGETTPKSTPAESDETAELIKI